MFLDMCLSESMIQFGLLLFTTLFVLSSYLYNLYIISHLSPQDLCDFVVCFVRPWWFKGTNTNSPRTNCFYVLLLLGSLRWNTQKAFCSILFRLLLNYTCSYSTWNWTHQNLYAQFHLQCCWITLLPFDCVGVGLFDDPVSSVETWPTFCQTLNLNSNGRCHSRELIKLWTWHCFNFPCSLAQRHLELWAQCVLSPAQYWPLPSFVPKLTCGPCPLCPVLVFVCTVTLI